MNKIKVSFLSSQSCSPCQKKGERKMKKLILFALITISIISLGTSTASGQDLSARGIMKKNDRQRKAENERLELEMKLINKKGKERVRKVTQIKKTDAVGNEKSLIRFLSPADVKGTGLLTIEHSERDDDQWLYLPALKKVRRISASNKSDNFVGTDFTYQDLKGEEFKNYNYKLLKVEKLDGYDCYVIAALPNNQKEKKESGYSKREIWIDKENFVNIQTRFYNKKEEFYKILKAGDIRLIEGENKWRAFHMEMENKKTNHKTILLFNKILINKGIADENFTQRYLERGR
jgi:outer membrane lipoprotein-sorting protein